MVFLFMGLVLSPVSCQSFSLLFKIYKIISKENVFFYMRLSSAIMHIKFCFKQDICSLAPNSLNGYIYLYLGYFNNVKANKILENVNPAKLTCNTDLSSRIFPKAPATLSQRRRHWRGCASSNSDIVRKMLCSWQSITATPSGITGKAIT